MLKLKVFWSMLIAVPLCAQSLQVSSVTVAPGAKAALEVSLASPGGKEPVALQFEISFSTKAINVDKGVPVVGPAAQSSGKAITCAGRWKQAPELYTYKCILAGGEKPIANGAVAVLNFKVPEKAPSGSHPIRIEEPQGVSADIKKIKIESANGSLTVK